MPNQTSTKPFTITFQDECAIPSSSVEAAARLGDKVARASVRRAERAAALGAAVPAPAPGTTSLTAERVVLRGEKIQLCTVESRNSYLFRRRQKQTKSRVYVSVEGESILENFANREARPADLYRAFLAKTLAPGTKLRWSRHAGCSSCPCSPGFIVEEGPQFRDAYGRLADAHITVSAQVVRS